MEAEYVALTECAKEIAWLRNVVDELCGLGMNLEKTLLFCDNKSAIHYARNKFEKSHTKHINIRIHYVRELLENKICELSHISGKRNPADFFTKAVPRDRLQVFVSRYFFVKKMVM